MANKNYTFTKNLRFCPFTAPTYRVFSSKLLGESKETPTFAPAFGKGQSPEVSKRRQHTSQCTTEVPPHPGRFKGLGYSISANTSDFGSEEPGSIPGGPTPEERLPQGATPPRCSSLRTCSSVG